MKTTALAILCLVGSTGPVIAQQIPQEEATAIRAVFDRLEDAGRAGDGEAWGREFAEDADFTVWFGLRLNGRRAIAEGHAFIFTRMYAGTTFHLRVGEIRLLSGDVAVVELEGRIGEAGGSLPEAPDAVPIAVLSRERGRWEIISFQNTPHLIEELGEGTNLRRFKLLVSESTGG